MSRHRIHSRKDSLVPDAFFPDAAYQLLAQPFMPVCILQGLIFMLHHRCKISFINKKSSKVEFFLKNPGIKYFKFAKTVTIA
jgi:hypothetical protein